MPVLLLDRSFLLSTFSEVRRVHLIGGLGYLLTSGGFAQLCKLRTYLLPGALPNCPKRVLTYFRGGFALAGANIQPEQASLLVLL